PAPLPAPEPPELSSQRQGAAGGSVGRRRRTRSGRSSAWEVEGVEDLLDGAVGGECRNSLVDVVAHEGAVGQRDGSDADPGLADLGCLEDTKAGEFLAVL